MGSSEFSETARSLPAGGLLGEDLSADCGGTGGPTCCRLATPRVEPQGGSSGSRSAALLDATESFSTSRDACLTRGCCGCARTLKTLQPRRIL